MHQSYQFIFSYSTEQNIHSVNKVMQLIFTYLLTALMERKSVKFRGKNIWLWPYQYRTCTGHMTLYRPKPASFQHSLFLQVQPFIVTNKLASHSNSHIWN